MIERYDVINRVLTLFENPSYLEIGVNAGETLTRVAARHKTGVDPLFAFDTTAPKARLDTTYHEVTSDKFFGEICKGSTFDVIYLDGLHTADQIIRDLLNAICLLKPKGVIVIDDVVPNSFHASLQTMEMANALRVKLFPDSTDRSWMGDVYKVVFFIKSFLQQFSYATIADNHGQLVVWKRARPLDTALELSRVTSLGYEHVWMDEPAFNKANMEDIMEMLRNRS